MSREDKDNTMTANDKTTETPDKETPKKTARKRTAKYPKTDRPEQGQRVQLSVSVDSATAQHINDVFFNARGTYHNRSDVVRAAIQEFLKKTGSL